MSKHAYPAYKEGQFVCIFFGEKGSIPRWHFGKISKIIPGRTIEEYIAEVFPLAIPDTYPTKEIEACWEHLFPSAPRSREGVMLSRLAARSRFRETDCFSRSVSVGFKNLCPAEFFAFRNRLTEGMDIFLQQHRLYR